MFFVVIYDFGLCFDTVYRLWTSGLPSATCDQFNGIRDPDFTASVRQANTIAFTSHVSLITAHCSFLLTVDLFPNMPCIIDSSVSEERSRCYLGIARVYLPALNFSHTLVQDKHRAVSPSNVARLVKIFERNGCMRLQEENVVHAVIRDEVLASALLEHHLTHEEFRDLHWAQDAPLLNISEVQCLSGLHRIEAAREHLDDNDKWWTVRLFSYSMQCDLSLILVLMLVLVLTVT